MKPCRIAILCLGAVVSYQPPASAQHSAPQVFLQFSDTADDAVEAEPLLPIADPRDDLVLASEMLPLPLQDTPSPTHPFDPTLVTQGETLFEQTCTECHEAERALDKRKSYQDWLRTVEEMAQQEDATIPRSSFVPIATYLASLGPPPPAPQSGPDTVSEGTDNEQRDSGSRSASQPRFDPQEVARGQTAFESSCTQCHDAQRALSKRKSRSGWLATVRRMARMDGANINAADMGPIATYLASRNGPQGGDTGDEVTAAGAAAGMGSGVNLSATISTLWRGGNDNLENPNFFADAWVRMDFQPEGPLGARVTTCTSCHSDQTGGGGFTMELVEATAYLDLMEAFRGSQPRSACGDPQIEAELRAGRFVVPFGGYHAMSHPGVYRTVTNPLIFNMGRQVQPDGSRPPVLPMPYADEGVDLHASIPWRGDWTWTLDGFAVNGLQGGGAGVNFTRSRSYADNNRHAGYGGRATLGSRRIRLGGSVMAGRLEDDGASPLNYHLAGADATARLCDDQVRLYFEYAIRRNDSIFGPRQISYGIVSEVEFVLLERPNLNALLRYDTLEHRDFFGESSIERFTWGLSTTIAGSLLILNHEHWNFPTDAIADVDVLGVRWVAAF